MAMKNVEEEVYYRVECINWAPRVDEFDNPIAGSGRTQLVFTEYPVYKRTATGVTLDYFSGTRRRHVSHNTKKQFAHATKEAALEAFIKRRHKQIVILQNQICSATAEMKMAIYMREHGIWDSQYLDRLPLQVQNELHSPI